MAKQTKKPARMDGRFKYDVQGIPLIEKQRRIKYGVPGIGGIGPGIGIPQYSGKEYLKCQTGRISIAGT
jgi:hypothetical protein